MKAVIMAGGEGSRLRPLTSNQPKPMMPLANLPMMEHIIGLLKRHGFDDIVVTLAFMPNAIRTYFGDGSEYGVRMVYATEEQPLGTAGSVRNAKDELAERFLVISGDVLTDIDLSKIVSFHESRGALATIGLVAVDNPLEFGIVITREDGSIERFLEKPTWGQVFSDTINTGIFVLEPEIFDYIPAGEAVDFSSEVFPKLLANNVPLFGAVGEGYWEDVGTLDAYVRVHKDALDGKVELEIPGFRLEHGVWLGEGAEIHPEAVVEGPAVIGENCRVERDARIGEYTVLGDNVRVREGADLERVVVHDNAYLGPSVRLRGTVVGRACDLRSGVRCEEGVVLGDECFVGDNAVLGAGVKVYPFKTVETAAVVNSSIVWESRRRSVPVRPRRCRRSRQCRRHARAGHAAGDGACDRVEEGDDGCHFPGLVTLGADAQTGDDGRTERRWRERARPRGGLGAGHPIRDPPAECGGRTHDPVGRVRPAIRRRALLRQQRLGLVRGRAAQDRAVVQP